MYWLCHLNPSGPRFGFFLVDLFLALFVAEGLVHLVSALVPFFIIGLVAAAGIYGAHRCASRRHSPPPGGFMLTEGFFLIKSNIPGWWVWMYYIGFHTYSFESFMYNEFSGACHSCAHSRCELTKWAGRTFRWDEGMRSAWMPRNGTNIVDGADVLDLYEMNHDHRVRSPHT